MSQGAAESPSIRLLYIDDDPGLGRLVERTLSRHGFHVSHALSGDEGLSRLVDGRFEIVALDHFMPGKEGLVHISQLADYRVPRVEDVVSIGDELMVVVTEIDRMGRVNLSRRAAMERHMAKAGAGSPDNS